jgi:D-psicose/D-tagatose/L-ribulose 3-epimerase
MTLALNTLMWAWDPFEDVLRHAEDLGVLALDLGTLPGCGHLRLPAGVGLAPQCEDLLDQLPAGARFLAVTADHHGLSSSDPTVRRAGIAYTLEAMQAARMLGAGVVGTSLGNVGEGREWAEAADHAVTTLGEVLERAPNAIRLAIEVHVDDVCNSLEKALHFVRGVGHHRLGVAFDTSLLFHNRIDIDAAFDALGDRCFHVHLRGATQDTYFAIPGRDEVDFARFFTRLGEVGYTGALSLELYGVQERYGITTVEALKEASPYVRAAGASPQAPQTHE